MRNVASGRRCPQPGISRETGSISSDETAIARPRQQGQLARKQVTCRTFRIKRMRRQYRITVSSRLCPLDDWPDDTNHPSTPSSVGKSLTAPQINILLLPVPDVSLWTHHLTQTTRPCPQAGFTKRSLEPSVHSGVISYSNEGSSGSEKHTTGLTLQQCGCLRCALSASVIE